MNRSRCVHIFPVSVVAVRVGIRELRARLASHLETATPNEVTRHGRTVGLYVPLPQESDLSDHERLLEAGRLMQAELQRLGLRRALVCQSVPKAHGFTRLRTNTESAGIRSRNTGRAGVAVSKRLISRETESAMLMRKSSDALRGRLDTQMKPSGNPFSLAPSAIPSPATSAPDSIGSA